MKRIITIGAALALLFAGVGRADADIITIFNTGVDATGQPLPDGTIGDPHYTLVSTPPGPTTDIRVRTSAGGYPIPPYVGDNSISAWIGPNNDPAVDGPVGAYDFRTTFQSPFAGKLTITGQWATDNEGIDILLNGASTGNSIPDPGLGAFTGFHPFTITGTALAGTNTLDFLENNDGGPTAVRVEIASASAVPEPTGLSLLGIGIVGLAGAWWRRKARA
jgi:hypothetical protein